MIVQNQQANRPKAEDGIRSAFKQIVDYCDHRVVCHMCPFDDCCADVFRKIPAEIARETINTITEGA